MILRNSTYYVFFTVFSLLFTHHCIAFQYAHELSAPDPLSANEHGISLTTHNEWLLTGSTIENNSKGQLRLYKNDTFIRHYTVANSSMRIGWENEIAINSEGIFAIGSIGNDRYLLIANALGGDYQNYFPNLIYLGVGDVDISADNSWAAVFHYSENKVSLINKQNGLWQVRQTITPPFQLSGGDLNNGRLVIRSPGVDNRISFYEVNSQGNWVIEGDLDTVDRFNSSAGGRTSLSDNFSAFIDGTDVIIYQRTWSGWSYFQTVPGPILNFDINNHRLVVQKVTGNNDREVELFELRGLFTKIGKVHVNINSGTNNKSTVFGKMLAIEGDNIYAADRNARYPEQDPSNPITPGVVYSSKWWYVY